MVSKALAKKKVGAREGFNWRGKEITRIEGLSDCVFGFAVTLLIISLEVPKTYGELYVILRGLPSFAVCFVLLMLVWHDQYIYFRRYGIEDSRTVVLTLTLLFIVLYYIFPLKFLWTVLMSPLTDLIFGATGDAAKAFSNIYDVAHLMMLYHIGIMAVYVVFTLMYSHAYKKREEIELNPVEVHDTRASIIDSLFFVGLGVLGILVILILGPEFSGISGMMYPVFIAPFFAIMGKRNGKKRAALLAEMDRSF
jgi:uncharacterized membrane protein